MNNLRLLLAFSSIIVFFGCVENENDMNIVWEKIPTQQAKALGAQTEGPIYLEKLVEIDPNTNEIVWQWHSVDFDPSNRRVVPAYRLKNMVHCSLVTVYQSLLPLSMVLLLTSGVERSTLLKKPSPFLAPKQCSW